MQIRPRVNWSLAAIVGEGLLSRLSFGLITFALPLYARHLGFSLTEVGILAALSSAVSVILKPLLGRTADRFGLKRTFMVAIGLRSLISLGYGFASAPWALFAIRGVYGLSMSLRDPSASALLAEQGGGESVASAFAWYQTAKTVAGSVSQACAGILLTVTAANYPLVFFVAFALSALPLLVVTRYVQEDAGAHGAPDTAARRPAQGDDAEPADRPAHPQPPKLLPFVGLGFLIAGTAEMLGSLFPVLATEYAGLSKAQAGLIYAVSTLLMVFAGPIFGWLSDNVSRNLVLMARGVLNTCSSALYVVAPVFVGVAVAKALDDMGKAAFRPAWGALMAQVSSFDRRHRARVMSWMSTGEDAGRALGPVLAGVLWSTWGIAVLMGVRILLAILTEVYTVSVTRLPALRAPGPDPLARVEDTAVAAGSE